MKFLWSTIAVNNMEESLRFYQEIVGLSIVRRFQAGPLVEIAFLGEGETQVELICDPNHKAPGLVEGISLGFQVKSLDEMISLAKDKELDIEGPFQPNPHVKFIYVKDPNGVSIQFVETM